MVEREELIAAGPTDIQVFIAKLARIFEWDIPSLCAPYWRCYVPLSPGGVMRSPEGEEYLMTPGTSFLITPETAASTRLLPGQSLLKAYCHFAIGTTGNVRPDIYPFPTPEPIMSAWQASGAESLGTMELTIHLVHVAMTGLTLLPSTAFESRQIDPRISSAIDLMTRTPSAPLDNAALADMVGMHVNSFSRLFSRETGKSPQAYCRRVRLFHASHLLTNSEDSIDQIAEACGFWDRNHFTRAFTRQWDCPPAEFRRRNRH